LLTDSEPVPWGEQNMKISIHEALEDAQAEAAVDALARRERGEALDADSAFDEAELQQIEQLRPAADPAQEAAILASFRAAVQPAAVTPLRRRSPWTGPVVAGVLAAAAGLALLVGQPFPLNDAPTLTKLAVGDRLLAGADDKPKIERSVPERGCLLVDLALKNSGALSEFVTARAYFEQGSRRLPWAINLTVKEGSLHVSPCVEIPAEVQAGTWNLVMLVGYPGLMKLFGSAALEHRSEVPTTSYRGIQIVREPITVQRTP